MRTYSNYIFRAILAYAALLACAALKIRLFNIMETMWDPDIDITGAAF